MMMMIAALVNLSKREL